jgi:hypothetical protein
MKASTVGSVICFPVEMSNALNLSHSSATVLLMKVEAPMWKFSTAVLAVADDARTWALLMLAKPTIDMEQAHSSIFAPPVVAL